MSALDYAGLVIAWSFAGICAAGAIFAIGGAIACVMHFFRSLN